MANVSKYLEYEREQQGKKWFTEEGLASRWPAINSALCRTIGTKVEKQWRLSCPESGVDRCSFCWLWCIKLCTFLFGICLMGLFLNLWDVGTFLNLCYIHVGTFQFACIICENFAAYYTIIQVHSYSMSYGYILVCIKCHLGTLFESVIWVHFNSLSYGTFFVCHMVKIFIEWYLGMILTECLCLRAVFVYKLFLCYKGLFCCMSVGFIYMFVSLMCIFL